MNAKSEFLAALGELTPVQVCQLANTLKEVCVARIIDGQMELLRLKEFKESKSEIAGRNSPEASVERQTRRVELQIEQNRQFIDLCNKWLAAEMEWSVPQIIKALKEGKQ